MIAILGNDRGESIRYNIPANFGLDAQLPLGGNYSLVPLIF